MTTTIMPKPFEQHLAEKFPLECCEDAVAIVQILEQPVFLSGVKKEFIILCGGCLKEVRPVTRTTLRP